jgi:hypothetical protein
MHTKRIWRNREEERRGEDRLAADFYAVELDGTGRYLRRITNVSASGWGLRMESPLGAEQPGQVLELELPVADDGAIRVEGEVVHTSGDGHVGIRIISEPVNVNHLGGRPVL